MLAATSNGDINAGNIPAELSQLSRLLVVNISENNLSGKSYDAISDASDGYDTNAGNIPAELSRLSSLLDLYLENNNLSGKSYNLISAADLMMM